MFQTVGWHWVLPPTFTFVLSPVTFVSIVPSVPTTLINARSMGGLTTIGNSRHTHMTHVASIVAETDAAVLCYNMNSMTTVPTRHDAMVKMPGVCDLFCEYEARDIVRHLQTLDARVCSYEKGEYVLHYGDPVDTAVIIVSGSLHSVHEMPTGETCVIRTLRVGYLAGAISLIVPQPRHLYSLYAPERTQVVTLSAKKTIAWRKDPESASFFRAIELQLFTYMQDMSRKCVVVSQPSVEKRIMTYLGIRCHEESAKTITVPGTEAEFASYLCAHPISVSRALNKLRNEGKIDYNRNVLTLLTPPPPYKIFSEL